MTVGVYIAGLGIGTLLSPKLQLKSRETWTGKLFEVETLLAAVGGLAPIVITILHIVYRIMFFDQGLQQYEESGVSIPLIGIWSQGIVLLVGILSGFELPILLKIHDADGKGLALFLAVYYVGALIGTVVFATILQQHFSPVAIGVMVGFLNLLIVYPYFTPVRFVGAAVVGIALALSAIGFNMELEQIQLKNFYYNVMEWYQDEEDKIVSIPPIPVENLAEEMSTYPKVERYRSIFHDIDIVRKAKSRIPGQGGDMYWTTPISVYMDGRFQFSSLSRADYHEFLVHMPILLTGKIPKNVLVLGGADGLALREIRKYDDVKTITLVDLDATLLELAMNHAELVNLNQDALRDERVEIIEEDAFRFIRTSRRTWDMIVIDFTYPFNFDSVRLFSVEFFRSIKNRLSEAGYFVQSTPIDFLSEDIKPRVRALQPTLVATMKSSGFGHAVSFNGNSDSYILGTKEKTKLQNEFWNQDISVQSFGPEYFEKVFTYDLSTVKVSGSANHIFFPSFFGIQDSAF